MIYPDKLKYKVNYNHSLYNFKTGRYESKRYTSAIHRLRPISGSARNVKGYYLLVAFTKIGNNFVYLHELHLPVSFLYMYQI